jgi:hypothetical protein
MAKLTIKDVFKKRIQFSGPLASFIEEGAEKMSMTGSEFVELIVLTALNNGMSLENTNMILSLEPAETLESGLKQLRALDEAPEQSDEKGEVVPAVQMSEEPLEELPPMVEEAREEASEEQTSLDLEEEDYTL